MLCYFWLNSTEPDKEIEMWKTAIFVLLACLGMFPACASESITPDQPEMLVGKEQTGFRAVLAENVGVEQALSLVGQLQSKNASLRLHYQDHEAAVAVAEGDTLSVVLAKEKERLTFISAQFHVDIPMEVAVKAEIEADLASLESTGPSVKSVEFKTGVNPKSSVIAKFETVSRPIVVHNDNPGLGTAVSALTDWTGDTWYDPAYGTSTISTSGTFQKFWLDTSSKNALNWVSDGLEIDTLVFPRQNATCGNDVGSNMPDWYKDTEAFDDFNYATARTCAVGTISAAKLQVGQLYWTWHSFGSVLVDGVLNFRVDYQPSRWCAYVYDTNMCRGYGAWCMCSRNDLPIEWLISYTYSEGAGVEEHWIKN